MRPWSAFWVSAGGGGVAVAALVTYDANQAFVAMELGSVPGTNPFSQFSVGYGATLGSFTAFGPTLHTNNFSGNANLQGYYVSNPQIVPAAVVNTANTSQEVAPGNGITALDPRQIYLHPGSLNLAAAHEGTINNAIVRFTAPTAGTYSIAGDWETLHFGTTGKQILVNGTSVFSDSGSAPSFNFTANLNVNDYVDFLVSPLGAIAGDSVGLRARLSTEVAVAPPTCTPPQVLQNGACVTPPPFCIAPQVLQGNVCVTPPPRCMSPQILQGGVCVTPRPQPSVATLARMSDAVYRNQDLSQSTPVPIGSYQQVACHDRDGFVISGNCRIQTVDAFKASVYKDGNQVVIAVRGTDPYDGWIPLVKNILADLSLQGDGTANALFGNYAKSLAKILHDVQQAYPDATITLTGHSLGGALAQLVGNNAVVRAITFDAPGVRDVLSVAQANDVVLALGTDVPYRSASVGREIANYRLQEDQVSLIGKGGTFEKNRQFGDVFTVYNPNAGANRDGWDAGQNHSITELADLLNSNCRLVMVDPTNCVVSGYGPDNGFIIRAAVAVVRIACPLWELARFSVICRRPVPAAAVRLRGGRFCGESCGRA